MVTTLTRMPDDVLGDINDFLFTDEQYLFACTSKNNKAFVLSTQPRIMNLPENMVTIRAFFSDHYFNAWTKCPACKRLNCCSAKCLVYIEDWDCH